MPALNRNRTPFIVIGVVVILVAAAIAYVLLAKPEPMSQFNESQNTGNGGSQQQGEPKPSEDPAQPMTQQPRPGKYVDYSQDTFASDTSDRKLLFFHANWCPQCRALEQDINAKGVPDDMTIFKVNYDTATGLRQKYGVTLQTTVVEVDSQGSLIKKHVAYNQPTLSATLDALGN